MSIKGSLWRCQKEKGLRINKLITGSKLPIHTIVHCIGYWAREMTSVTFCKCELKMGQNDVFYWNNYLYEMKVYLYVEKIMLDAFCYNGFLVEYVGKQEHVLLLVYLIH
ncbi:Hypothetical protein CINCED_3A013585 [Cinara cedri]|uniref:Uncharacterized protein n=1 Tax=Cinara cedri TaxID=506608 RepID=A0A5E4MQB7_9HEMI|nr:Hypothetical protein CINCED_3A013585 [Cinara cedri]